MEGNYHLIKTKRKPFSQKKELISKFRFNNLCAGDFPPRVKFSVENPLSQKIPLEKFHVFPNSKQNMQTMGKFLSVDLKKAL